MIGNISKLADRITGSINRRIFRPSIIVEEVAGLTRLGSVYGGWTIKDAQDLVGCVAISCGLGEDASFDVEFAARYGADMVLVDPTPRSVTHYDQLVAHVGQSASTAYVKGGCQPVEAYDMSAIRPEQLRLEPKALWIDEEPVRFYKPANPAHVSHSVCFGAEEENADYILVPTVTLAGLLANLPQDRFALLKMDIEGAETEILSSIAQWPVLPRQLLVEFDVLRSANAQSKAQVERIDALLRSQGYACCHFDGERNYLYLR
ncbi:FkbM family methyltransferase [Novosphingobium gossypii]|uniref:FkbM family methyltransferase n=1 Tax=Novosphingobium gossypii TaxID=1604774 RepID=UPI003D19A458